MDVEHEGYTMSIEYTIHFEKIDNDIFSMITKSIKDRFPMAQYSDSDLSLWIPSSNPSWIDFSIEKSENDIFIVDNLDRIDSKKIFSVIESILISNKIEYSIEEI